MKQKKKAFNLSYLVLFIILLIIPLLFFLLLDSRTGSGFGVEEMAFSVIFAIITILFLVWIRIMMRKNPHLGLIIGILLLASFSYSLFFKYKGPITALFAIVTGAIILFYLIYTFLKTRKSKPDKEDIEIDE